MDMTIHVNDEVSPSLVQKALENLESHILFKWNTTLENVPTIHLEVKKQEKHTLDIRISSLNFFEISSLKKKAPRSAIGILTGASLGAVCGRQVIDPWATGHFILDPTIKQKIRSRGGSLIRFLTIMDRFLPLSSDQIGNSLPRVLSYTIE